MSDEREFRIESLDGSISRTIKVKAGELVELNENEVAKETRGFTDDLHRRLRVQARNLLLEYRLGSGSVPHEKVQELMELYGNLIAKLIMEDQREAWDEVIRDIDWATSSQNNMGKIRVKYGLKD